MLKKLYRKRKLIALILAAMLLFAWLTYLIFGNEGNKLTNLILTPILPFLVYIFMRLVFKVIRTTASPGILEMFLRFFFIVGSLGALIMTIGFILSFPNSLSPSLGGCMGMIIAAISEPNTQNFQRGI